MNKLIKLISKLLGKRTQLKVYAYIEENQRPFDILHNDYKWRKIRNKYIKGKPYCELCLENKKLEVHHIIPWHVSVLKRFDLSNLITLCRYCHFRFGHWRDWKRYNTRISTLKSTITEFRKADENRD